MQEHHIEKHILNYLERRGGVVRKIMRSGVPVYQGGKSFKLRKAKNKYANKFMSDIYYFANGQQYFFEVKKPEQKTVNLLKRFNQDRIFLLRCAQKSAYETIAGQFLFLEEFVKNGGPGGFVFSVGDVEKIIMTLPKKIYIPELI